MLGFARHGDLCVGSSSATPGTQEPSDAVRRAARPLTGAGRDPTSQEVGHPSKGTAPREAPKGRTTHPSRGGGRAPKEPPPPPLRRPLRPDRGDGACAGKAVTWLILPVVICLS